MIEKYVRNNKGEKVKSYAPVLIGYKVLNAAQSKMLIYCKEFLSLYFALQTFSPFIWGSEKPVLLLIDDKSLTRFFQAKTIPHHFRIMCLELRHLTLWLLTFKEKPMLQQIFYLACNQIRKKQLNWNLERIPIREIEVRCTSKATRQHKQWALCRQFNCWPTPGSRYKHINNPQTIGNLWSGSEPTKEFDIKQGTTPDEIQQENKRNERHSTHKPTGWLARIGNNNG